MTRDSDRQGTVFIPASFKDGHPWDGRRFRLLGMGDDEPHPVPPGSTGTIDWVVPWGEDELHLNVTWDEGVNRSLNLIVPTDQIELLEEGEA